MKHFLLAVAKFVKRRLSLVYLQINLRLYDAMPFDIKNFLNKKTNKLNKILGC